MKQLATPLLLAALVGSAATASAQTTFRLGVRGGLNRANTTLSETQGGYFVTYANERKSATYTWQAGAVLEANFGKLAFQPAILFSQKGEKYYAAAYVGDFGVSLVEQSSTNHYNWLEVPLNLVYTLHGDHGLQVFAGPYVAVAVGGRQRGTATSQTLFVPNSVPIVQDLDGRIAYDSNSTNQRVDAGVNFGLGYRQGPLQLQLGYGLGLRDLHRPDRSYGFNATTAYNRVAQLTGTYFFSL
ncbi:outer membrane beta-barrel protein [Hymenobacter psoromatis]|uniref:outer membrane beta-barrel protein n=1 Tax=Hymenobacter psoromatis TaxID=1484116 RepID=UPI001CBCD44A|nr:outer membrane beta-barrel protein [Hymenobacter psoromatis]